MVVNVYVCFASLIFVSTLHFAGTAKTGSFNVSFAQARSNICMREAPCKNDGVCHMPYPVKHSKGVDDYVCGCKGPFRGKHCEQEMTLCTDPRVVNEQNCWNFTGMIICGYRKLKQICWYKPNDFAYWEKLLKNDGIKNPCDSKTGVMINMECELMNTKCIAYYSFFGGARGMCHCEAGFLRYTLCRTATKIVNAFPKNVKNCMQAKTGVYCYNRMYWERMATADDTDDKTLKARIESQERILSKYRKLKQRGQLGKKWKPPKKLVRKLKQPKKKVVVETVVLPLKSDDDDTEQNPCLPTNPCLHNGICRPHPLFPWTKVQCACPLGRIGTKCNDKLSNCDDVEECRKLGDCVLTPSGAVCVCKDMSGSRICNLVFKHRESNWVLLIIPPTTLKDIEIGLGCIAVILILTLIGFIFLFTKGMQKSVTAREEYMQALKKGVTLTELPPDMIDISKEMFQKLFCCCNLTGKETQKSYSGVSSSGSSDDSSEGRDQRRSKVKNKSSNSVPWTVLTRAVSRWSPRSSDSCESVMSALFQTSTTCRLSANHKQYSPTRTILPEPQVVIPVQPKYSTFRVYPNSKHA